MARGRDATDPTEIPGKGWIDIFWRVKSSLSKDRMSLIAAGIAFYGLMALFPAISALVAITALFADPQMLTQQINQMAGMVPEAVTEIVAGQVQEVTGSRDAGLGFALLLGLGIAIYSASKGTGSLMQGVNAAYSENEERGFFKLNAVKLALTLFIVLGMAAGLAVTLAVPALTALMNENPVLEALAAALVYAILLALTVAGLAVIYRFAPSRDDAQLEWLTPGAVLATVLWVAASAGFAFYVSKFGSYNETFGALAGVVILLMWFWISAFIVLLGAEINAEIEAQTRRDTTVGPKEPMGERGAEKADHLGEAHAT